MLDIYNKNLNHNYRQPILSEAIIYKPSKIYYDAQNKTEFKDCNL
jgi:hypothetical protein